MTAYEERLIRLSKVAKELGRENIWTDELSQIASENIDTDIALIDFKTRVGGLS